MPLDDTNGRARLRADLHTLPAANTAAFNDGSIHARKVERNGALAERANHDAGAADAAIDPRVTRIAIDLCNTHVDFANSGLAERVGRAGNHALTAQRARFRTRLDVGRVGCSAAVAPMKLNAARWADFAAKSAADTRRVKGRIFDECTRRFERAA